MKKLLAVLTAAAAFASISAQAQIINIQVVAATGTPYAGTGADLLDTGTTWNQVLAPGYTTNGPINTGTTATALKTSTGTVTTDTAVVADQGNFNNGATTGLFNQGSSSYSTGSPSSLTISTGLANQLFTLYIYSQEANATQGNATAFSLVAANGSATSAVTSPAPGTSGTFTLGVNYTTLNGVTSSTGLVTLDYLRASSSGTTANHGDLDGVQLDFNAALVPEPSTYALMAAGLGALVFFARRRLNA